uniref:Uncharacterized protein n=1 Tax=Pipistrellus kuhlii TaxID=59472 RepID=A0A7J7YNR1_PIPKU|nr:hypothetical protein mPipKuh1_010137 [Pipistrellus kuhlii]
MNIFMVFSPLPFLPLVVQLNELHLCLRDQKLRLRLWSPERTDGGLQGPDATPGRQGLPRPQPQAQERAIPTASNPQPEGQVTSSSKPNPGHGAHQNVPFPLLAERSCLGNAMRNIGLSGLFSVIYEKNRDGHSGEG